LSIAGVGVGVGVGVFVLVGVGVFVLVGVGVTETGASVQHSVHVSNTEAVHVAADSQSGTTPSTK